MSRSCVEPPEGIPRSGRSRTTVDCPGKTRLWRVRGVSHMPPRYVARGTFSGMSSFMGWACFAQGRPMPLTAPMNWGPGADKREPESRTRGSVGGPAGQLEERMGMYRPGRSQSSADDLSETSQSIDICLYVMSAIRRDDPVSVSLVQPDITSDPARGEFVGPRTASKPLSCAAAK